MIEPTTPGTVVICMKDGRAYQLEDWGISDWGRDKGERRLWWFVAGNWEGNIPWSEIAEMDPKVIWEPADD